MGDELKKEDQSLQLVPGIGAAYGHGWRQMWEYFLELLLIVLADLHAVRIRLCW